MSGPENGNRCAEEQLEKTGAATRTEAEPDSEEDGTRVEAESQDTHSETKQAEKAEEKCD